MLISHLVLKSFWSLPQSHPFGICLFSTTTVKGMCGSQGLHRRPLSTLPWSSLRHPLILRWSWRPMASSSEGRDLCSAPPRNDSPFRFLYFFGQRWVQRLPTLTGWSNFCGILIAFTARFSPLVCYSAVRTLNTEKIIASLPEDSHTPMPHVHMPLFRPRARRSGIWLFGTAWVALKNFRWPRVI